MFLLMGLGVSDLSFLCLSSGVNFSEFMGTAYGTELVDYKTVKQATSIGVFNEK